MDWLDNTGSLLHGIERVSLTSFDGISIKAKIFGFPLQERSLDISN